LETIRLNLETVDGPSFNPFPNSLSNLPKLRALHIEYCVYNNPPRILNFNPIRHSPSLRVLHFVTVNLSHGECDRFLIRR